MSFLKLNEAYVAKRQFSHFFLPPKGHGLQASWSVPDAGTMSLVETTVEFLGCVMGETKGK
jgi:hypothetical protein